MTDEPRSDPAQTLIGAIVYVTTVLGGACLIAPDRVGDLKTARDLALAE